MCERRRTAQIQSSPCGRSRCCKLSQTHCRDQFEKTHNNFTSVKERPRQEEEVIEGDDEPDLGLWDDSQYESVGLSQEAWSERVQALEVIR